MVCAPIVPAVILDAVRSTMCAESISVVAVDAAIGVHADLLLDVSIDWTLAK